MLSIQEQLKEYDRVVAMCKGTKFEGEEYKCIKVKYYNEDNYNAYNYSNKPAMDQQYDRIFAIAIVDDTPIWLEEPVVLYTKTSCWKDYEFICSKKDGLLKGYKKGQTANISIQLTAIHWNNFTLTKPNTLIKPETEEEFIAKFNQSIVVENNIGYTEPTSFASALPIGVDSKQVGGNHYESKAIQPWAYMEANFTKEEFVGFLRGNAHKYLDRYKDKNGIEDLKKAIHYIEKLIQVESK